MQFDLRLYVLVTAFRPLTVLMHASGIVRFATERYADHRSDLTCARAHLCNYAINKGGDKFVRSVGGESEVGGQAGSIWSLEGFKSRLAADLGAARAARVWDDVDRLVVLTLAAAAPRMRCTDDVLLDAAQAACCFQLFGFDVMLDANARPWLLEVNGDPGLRTESPIFLAINAPMVADLLNVVGLSAKARAEPRPEETRAGDEGDDRGDEGPEAAAIGKAGDADAAAAAAERRIQELREEAARRHSQHGQAALGQWRRLHPSERSKEWTRALSEEEAFRVA